MNGLQVFEHSEFGKLHVMLIDGKEYFPATECAKLLGYANPRKAIADHCRCVTKRYAPHPQNPVKAIEMSFIPEGDLYRLIIRSKLSAAEKFERWVFDEVLPAIRRHGVYAVDEVLSNPDMLIAALTELKAEREKAKALAQTVAIQNQQITEMQSKASYYDVVLNCKDLVSVSVIAKDYGWSANRLNQYLHEKGVQYKQGNKIWLLYQKYAERGYTSTKTQAIPRSDGTLHTTVHTYWTQAGRLFIYDLLKANGILPTIERMRKHDTRANDAAPAAGIDGKASATGAGDGIYGQ